MKSISELRQDIVSGDWVVIATGRAKRPDQFVQEKRKKIKRSRGACPFESLSDDALLVFALDKEKIPDQWRVEVVKNIYPAVGEGSCAFFYHKGPYFWTGGTGFHEVVVTRDHDRSPAQMSREENELIIRAYQERYRAMKKDKCVEYISVFHNHGRNAGATLYHSHSQIIALPVIPPDVGRSFEGSAQFYKKNSRCVYCAILRYELKEKKRLIYKNDAFVAMAPFAAKSAFEIRIFPIRHQPQFEEIIPHDRRLLADVLRVVLAKIYRGLRDPDYNFFIHTAPTKHTEKFLHYHWHFEILPKTSVWAGFEIGTGIEISTITPEAAASYLRKIKIK